MESNSDFAAHEARTRELNARLAAAPVVDLVGVVDASGPGGGQWRGEKLWTVRLSLEAWRVDAGPMHTRRMTARRAVTAEELAEWQRRVEPLSVVRGRARVVDEAAFLRPEALLEEAVVVEQGDEELAAYAARLRQPVVHEDPEFGTLVLDRRIDTFDGHADWNGKRIAIRISTGGDGGPSGGLETLRELWRDQPGWAARVDDYAVRELLPLKNDNWLDEDEAPLSPDDFKARIRLESISVDGPGSFTFWHDDGDLFLGHCVQICGTVTAGPTSADIPG